jgi:hypothetical protein
MLYVTLIMTAIYTYAPFTTLIWYKQGVPHNARTEYEYRVICPDWLPTDNITELEALENKLQTSDFGDKIYIQLDRSCKSAVNWCKDHPEVQGKYVDSTPSILTYDEFEVCYTFFQEYAKEFIFQETGDPCDPFNVTNTCPDRGDCGLRSMPSLSYTNTSNADNKLFQEEYICCHSQSVIPFESTRYQDAGYARTHDQLGNVVCNDQPVGGLCFTSAMCEGGAICEDGICVGVSEISAEEGQDENGVSRDKEGYLGSPCDRDHAACSSGFCWNGTCQQHPQICPFEKFVLFTGLRLVYWFSSCHCHAIVFALNIASTILRLQA